MRLNKKKVNAIIFLILIILGFLYMFTFGRIFSGKLHVPNTGFVIALLIIIAIIVRISLEKKIGNIK